mmetsp:Transcript_17000/g.49531  ORF Transcript_17000/g.49531 Transcript_17000/m.49531 type:complete len:317 (-) Transcript_17000:134-1084(-)
MRVIVSPRGCQRRHPPQPHGWKEVVSPILFAFPAQKREGGGGCTGAYLRRLLLLDNSNGFEEAFGDEVEPVHGEAPEEGAAGVDEDIPASVKLGVLGDPSGAGVVLRVKVDVVHGCWGGDDPEHDVGDPEHDTREGVEKAALEGRAAQEGERAEGHIRALHKAKPGAPEVAPPCDEHVAAVANDHNVVEVELELLAGEDVGGSLVDRAGDVEVDSVHRPDRRPCPALLHVGLVPEELEEGLEVEREHGRGRHQGHHVHVPDNLLLHGPRRGLVRVLVHRGGVGRHKRRGDDGGDQVRSPAAQEVHGDQAAILGQLL